MKSFIKCLLMGGFFCGVLHASEPVKSNGVPADMVRLVVGDLTRDVPKNVAKLSPFLRGALAIAQKDEPVIKLSSKFIDESVFDLTINLLTGLEKRLDDGTIPSPIPDLTKVLTTVNLPEKGSSESITLIKAAHYLGVKLLVCLLVNRYGDEKEVKGEACNIIREPRIVSRTVIVKGLSEDIQKDVNRMTFSLKELMALNNDRMICHLGYSRSPLFYRDEDDVIKVDLSSFNIVSLDGLNEFFDQIEESLKLYDFSSGDSDDDELRQEISSSDPRGYLSNVKNIDLSNNKLTSLPEGAFQRVKDLSVIDLSYNQLKCLPQKIFKNMGEVYCLDLSHNQLGNLPEKVFIDFYSPEIIDLSYNYLSDLSKKTFEGLNGLQDTLNLSHNKLRCLPKEVFQAFYSIAGTLNLSHNQLSSLPAGLFEGQSINGEGNCARLEDLDLSYNQLIDLPERVFEPLESLFNLDLQNNPSIRLSTNIIEDFPINFCIDYNGKRYTGENVDTLKEVLKAEENAERYINSALQAGGSVEIGGQGAGASDENEGSDEILRAGAARGAATDKSSATIQPKKRPRR